MKTEISIIGIFLLIFIIGCLFAALYAYQWITSPCEHFMGIPITDLPARCVDFFLKKGVN